MHVKISREWAFLIEHQRDFKFNWINFSDLWHLKYDFKIFNFPSNPVQEHHQHAIVKNTKKIMKLSALTFHDSWVEWWKILVIK